MQPDEFLKKILESMNGDGAMARFEPQGQKEKLGKKLCDLTAEEQVAWELGKSKSEALRKSERQLLEAAEDCQQECRTWWRKVRHAHKITEVEKIHIENGALYEFTWEN